MIFTMFFQYTFSIITLPLKINIYYKSPIEHIFFLNTQSNCPIYDQYIDLYFAQMIKKVVYILTGNHINTIYYCMF